MIKETLFNKNFTLLWLGQTVSEIGNSAGSIALLWWVTTVTGSVLALGTLAMIRGIVAVLFAPFAGAIADKLDRKKIIVWTDFLQGLVYALLAYLAFNNQLTISIIYVLGALSTAISQLFIPAIGASMPLIVPDKHLSKSNSLRQMSSSIVKIVGYAAGGIGIAIFGIPMLFLINSISFFLSSFSEIFITIPKIIESTKLPSPKEIVADVMIGFNYVKENKTLLKLIKFVMIVNMWLVPILLLMPKFVEDHLKAGSEVYGFILSGAMIGSLLGAIIMSVIPISEKYPFIIKWNIVGTGLLLLSLPFLPTQYWQLHVIVYIAANALGVIFNISAITVLQRSTPKEHLGKIFGFVGTLSNGITPAAQGLTGVIAYYVAVPIVFAISSCGTALTGLRFALAKDLIGWFVRKDTLAEDTSTSLAPSN